jgi:hypothetical protein
MPDPGTSLTGAVETIDGAGIGVYQDHDGVRIDAHLTEYMLDRPAAIKLRDAINTALVYAAVWEVDNADD